jgi:hypothetical protein
MIQSDILIMHGLQLGELDEMFHSFLTFQDMDEDHTDMLSKGGNGFVIRVGYRVNDYLGFMALKTSIRETTDNIMYEYTVGQHINTLSVIYPCFIRTLGILKYKNELSLHTVLNTDVITKKMLQTMHPIKPSISTSCVSPTTLCVMIDDVYKGEPMREHMSVDFASTELLKMLFIVYHALSLNKNTFTHYDMHDENVMIYEPFPSSFFFGGGKVVQYHYHLPDDKVLIFSSQYIPKIIDYGRCYFKNDTTTSEIYRTKVCKTKTCIRKETCGTDRGYRNLSAKSKTKVIRASINNKSQDIRLLHIVHRWMSKHMPDHALSKLTKKVVFGVGFTKSRGRYATNENLTISSSKIYNVQGAYDALYKLLISSNTKDSRPIGSIIHVYSDGRPMEAHIL